MADGVYDAGVVGDPDSTLADSVDAPESVLVRCEAPGGRCGPVGSCEDSGTPVVGGGAAGVFATAARFDFLVLEEGVVPGCRTHGAVVVLGAIDVAAVDVVVPSPGAPGPVARFTLPAITMAAPIRWSGLIPAQPGTTVARLLNQATRSIHEPNNLCCVSTYVSLYNKTNRVDSMLFVKRYC